MASCQGANSCSPVNLGPDSEPIPAGPWAPAETEIKRIPKRKIATRIKMPPSDRHSFHFGIPLVIVAGGFVCKARFTVSIAQFHTELTFSRHSRLPAEM